MAAGNNWLVMLVYVLPGLIRFLVLIGMLIYAIQKRSEFPSRARLVIYAVAIMMTTWFAGPIVQFLTFRMGTPETVLIGSLVSSFVSALLGAVALFLLVKAVFMNTAPFPHRPGDDRSGVPLADQPSGNPYASPRV